MHVTSTTFCSWSSSLCHRYNRGSTVPPSATRPGLCPNAVLHTCCFLCCSMACVHNYVHLCHAQFRLGLMSSKQEYQLTAHDHFRGGTPTKNAFRGGDKHESADIRVQTGQTNHNVPTASSALGRVPYVNTPWFCRTLTSFVVTRMSGC